MGKLLIFVLGLGAIAAGVWWALQRTDSLAASAAAQSEVSAPKRQLDNVRDAKRRIEEDEQRRLDETLQRATGP